MRGVSDLPEDLRNKFYQLDNLRNQFYQLKRDVEADDRLWHLLMLGDLIINLFVFWLAVYCTNLDGIGFGTGVLVWIVSIGIMLFLDFALIHITKTKTKRLMETLEDLNKACVTMSENIYNNK